MTSAGTRGGHRVKEGLIFFFFLKGTNMNIFTEQENMVNKER